MLAARDALRDDLRAAADAYGAYVVGLALAVAADFARYASRAQRNAGALDFDDLLGRARDLLSGAHEPDKARVVATRRHFQRRYRYLLVDEFQDTDPLQAEIAFLLAEREPTAASWRDVELQPGKLFLVGDPKQSIYRFRRADIAMYHEVGELVEGQGGEVLTLRQNFRTVASVVGWVNGAFGELIGPDELPGLQPAYSALTPARADGEPGRNVRRGRGAARGRAGAGGQVRPPTLADLCRREADLIAALLTDRERLGWRVHAGKRPHDGWRTAQPGDVAILLPTFTFVGFYEQALREAGLPYRVDGGRTFFNRREVLDTLAVLQALDTAADPVAVYSALHGQLFAFSDDDLYEFHAAGGVFDYLGAAPPAGVPRDRRGARRPARAPRTAQPAAARRDARRPGAPHRPAREPRPVGRRSRPGHRQHRRARVARRRVRAERRGHVPRLRGQDGARRVGRRHRRVAGRRARRLRAPHDRPQGQGPRVSHRRAGGRHARRPA